MCHCPGREKHALCPQRPLFFLWVGPVPKDVALKTCMFVCPPVCSSVRASVRPLVALSPFGCSSGAFHLFQKLGASRAIPSVKSNCQAFPEPNLSYSPRCPGHMCGLSLGTGRDACSQPPAPIAIDVEVSLREAMATLFCLSHSTSKWF